MARSWHNRKVVLLVIFLSVAVALCGLNHVGPMNGPGHHAHPVSAACASILCVTLTSQGSTLSGKTAVVSLHPVVLALSGFSPHFSEINPGRIVLLFNKDHLPGASNKLYRLHAVYLL